MKKYLIDFIDRGGLAQCTVIEETEQNINWTWTMPDNKDNKDKQDKQSGRSNLILTNHQIIFLDPETQQQHSFDIHDFGKIKIGKKNGQPVASFRMEGPKGNLALVKKDLPGQHRTENPIQMESNIKRIEEIRQKIDAIIERKKKEHRQPSKFEEREKSLKAIELKLNPILADAYKNLVHDKKIITDSQFWNLHNSQALLQFHTNQLNQYVQRARRIRMAQIEQSLINDKKPENVEQQRHVLKQAITANTKFDDTSNQHYNRTVEQADNMYFQRKDLYDKYVKEEKMEEENEGVRITQLHRDSNKMEIEEIGSQPITLPPMNIPNNPVKFQVKNDVMNTFLSRQRGRRPQQTANNKQRQLTTKTVQYLKIFYDCMDKKSPNIQILQKQITELQKEVADKNMELQKFIKRAQDAYMKFRRTGQRL